jgi:hypothetical protein
MIINLQSCLNSFNIGMYDIKYSISRMHREHVMILDAIWASRNSRFRCRKEILRGSGCVFPLILDPDTALPSYVRGENPRYALDVWLDGPHYRIGRLEKGTVSFPCREWKRYLGRPARNLFTVKLR